MRVFIHTSWGDIVMEEEGGILQSCTLPTLHHPPRKPFAVTGVSSTDGDVTSKTLRDVKRFAKACFEGRAATLPSFAFPDGSAFHRKVWKALLRIPAGRTQSYGELARRIGHPRAARAVGQACGANPLPLIIPCHRVTAAHGGLGGFSCGLAWKELLLDRERAVKD